MLNKNKTFSLSGAQEQTKQKRYKQSFGISLRRCLNIFSGVNVSMNHH